MHSLICGHLIVLWLYLCLSSKTTVCVCVCVCAFVCVCVHMCACVWVHLCVCVCARVHVYICAWEREGGSYTEWKGIMSFACLFNYVDHTEIVLSHPVNTSMVFSSFISQSCRILWMWKRLPRFTVKCPSSLVLLPIELGTVLFNCLHLSLLWHCVHVYFL